MATQKPISTVSYNTEPFLKEVLNTLMQQHIICSYQYIKHIGENGDKDHIHLRLEPNTRIDPMSIRELFDEYTIDNVKPLRCMDFRFSKEEDFILYVVHDRDYLKQKYGEDWALNDGKIPYDWQDIQCPEHYLLEEVYIRARAYMKHSSTNLANRIMKGEDPLNMIKEGESAYLVNTIMSACSRFDYARLHNELENALKEKNLYLCYLRSLGYDVRIDEKGETYLVSLDNE